MMRDCNHGHIQWKSLDSFGLDDQQFLLLIQSCDLTQHVLKPTRGGNVLVLVFPSQNELVDNVKMCDPLGYSDHNQIRFSITFQTENILAKTFQQRKITTNENLFSKHKFN